MITSPWGTPEYNQQQQAMWAKQAAEQQQRQNAANEQMRRQQVEQQQRAAADRQRWDTIAGMTGLAAPMNGDYNAFRYGRNIVGRDHNGEFHTSKKPQSCYVPSSQSSVTSRSKTSSGVGVLVFLLMILCLGLIAIAS